MHIADILRTGRQPLVLGVDDGPSVAGQDVSLCAVVATKTRFEGMLWGRCTRDGFDVTERLADLICTSKFAPQLHAILTDGVTFGGLNVLDLEQLYEATGCPVIAVMRARPDLLAMRRVMDRLPQPDVRRNLLTRAGDIHESDLGYFQVVGAEVPVARHLLATVTDRGHVPECIRMAHLIGSAVQRGSSGRRA